MSWVERWKWFELTSLLLLLVFFFFFLIFGW
jgi:hypothetical protein